MTQTTKVIGGVLGALIAAGAVWVVLELAKTPERPPAWPEKAPRLGAAPSAAPEDLDAEIEATRAAIRRIEESRDAKPFVPQFPPPRRIDAGPCPCTADDPLCPCL